jgi:hypothetical protein
MPQHDPRTALSRRSIVSSITVTKKAEDVILRACRDPAAQGLRQQHGDMPLLLWSKKTTFISNSGEKSEFGPQFYLHWTNPKEVEDSKYATVILSTDIEIALSPGEFFRSGSHQIDLRDGKLILDN